MNSKKFILQFFMQKQNKNKPIKRKKTLLMGFEILLEKKIKIKKNFIWNEITCVDQGPVFLKMMNSILGILSLGH